MKKFKVGHIIAKIIIALVLGALGAELMNVFSKDPNHRTTPDNTSTHTIIIAVILFLLLTFFSTGQKEGIK